MDVNTVPTIAPRDSAISRHKPMLLLLWLGWSWLCPLGHADSTNDHNQPALASRAMLEFLADFSELDQTEFELLAVYAERDTAQAAQDGNAVETPLVQPANALEAQPDSTNE